MKKLIAVFGIVLIVGCATTTPAPEATTAAAAAPVTEETRVEHEVLQCVNDLMAQQAHVMDATKACGYIFGLKQKHGVRTTDFQ